MNEKTIYNQDKKRYSSYENWLLSRKAFMTFYNVHRPSYTCNQEGSIISHNSYLNLDVYIQNYCF